MTRKTVFVLLLAGALLWGCGSGPDPVEPLDSPTAKRSADEIWRTAQEKESTGDRVESFGRIQWLQEAMLEYQILVDKHPRSRWALDARKKVKTLRRRVDELNDWKRRVDDFEMQSSVMMTKPGYLEKATKDVEALSISPHGFIKAYAVKRLEVVRKAAEKTVRSAFDRIRVRVDACVAKKDWPSAWNLFGSYDPEYNRNFPGYGEHLREMQRTVDKRSREDAAGLLSRADRKVAEEKLFAAVQVIARGKGRFRGLPVQKDLEAQERSLRARAKEKIVTDRKIESKVAPPEPAPEPEPETKPLPPDSFEAKAKEAMKSPEVHDEVPKPKNAFEDGSRTSIPTSSKRRRNRTKRSRSAWSR
ncbi:MAG: hypothetical protein ACYTHM_18925 [Planctomycetota bacterium]|jgi:hypothetical protein